MSTTEQAILDKLQGKSDEYKRAMIKVALALVAWHKGEREPDPVAPALDELQKVIDSENN